MSGVDSDETIHAKRQRLARIPRACEACKIRKIRCDRLSPCSNCRTSGITCQNTNVAPANRSKLDTVTQLKQSVERLDERLGRIERQITSQSVSFERVSHLPVSETVGAENRISNDGVTGTTGPYEGASSFTDLSTVATEAAQKTATLEGNGEDPTLGASLNSLETLLRPSSMTSVNDHRFSRNPAPRHPPVIDLLPAKLIISVLQRMKMHRPIFLTSYAINDPSLVENLCQKAYFPTEAISIGHLTAMHGVLYFLLREYITMSDPLCREYDLERHLAKCEQNVNAGLEAYEVLATSTCENILALTMGVIKSQEEAKPLLCLSLISLTASHLQMLGYHRERTYQNCQSRNAENMRQIFWTIYIFDKNLSLLGGRASCMPDFEIDTCCPALPIDPTLRPWDESFLVGIKLARLQGRIYTNLYSATALKSIPSERGQHIHEIATALEELREELDNIDASQVRNPQIFALSRKHWDVMYYSTLTSLLRASPTPGPGVEISSQCFRAARLSLQSHINCFSGYQESEFLQDADYANWVLHCSSFTPFLVIFLHAIAGTSLEDVQLLTDVVKILKRLRGTSKYSERLYQICGAFSQLARGLVETRGSCEGTMGKYGPHENSLPALDQGGQMPMFHLDSIQDSVGEDVTDYLVDWEAQDMSAILNSWASGEQSALGMFHNTMEGER